MTGGTGRSAKLAKEGENEERENITSGSGKGGGKE